MPSTSQQPRTIQTDETHSLDIRSLILLAVLLAAGFILNFTLGKAIASLSGGAIGPEFIISAFCLTILIERPSLIQAGIIGLVSAAVIQITTNSPFIDFAAESISAMLMAALLKLEKRPGDLPLLPLIATFITTTVSGLIFMVIKVAIVGGAAQLVPAMLPVIILTAAFNAIVVQALYIPLCKALKIGE